MRRLTAVTLLLALVGCAQRVNGPTRPQEPRRATQAPIATPSPSPVSDAPTQAQMDEEAGKIADLMIAGPTLVPAAQELRFWMAAFVNCTIDATFNQQAPFKSVRQARQVAKQFAKTKDWTVWAFTARRIPGSGYLGLILHAQCNGQHKGDGGRGS